jgi:hypothetical protein
VPIGLKAELCGGLEIDSNLLKIIIDKAKKQGILWKDDPIDRAIRSDKPGKKPVFLVVEEAKIKLSEAIGRDARLNDDFSHIKEHIILEEGTLHPDREISVELTGNDLKRVIREIWRRKYSAIINDTLNEAREKLRKNNMELGSIDKVLIAGGSSKLPFMKEEIYAILSTLIDKDNIIIGKDIGDSVAIGIACECKERISRDPKLGTGWIAPCLMNDLYLGFRKNRKAPIQLPKIKHGGTFKKSNLFLAPFETKDWTIDYEIELPFETNEKVFYCFNDKPFSKENASGDYQFRR